MVEILSGGCGECNCFGRNAYILDDVVVVWSETVLVVILVF